MVVALRHVQEAHDYAEYMGMEPLRAYLAQYVPSRDGPPSRAIPLPPEPRSRFAWFVAGVLGQRVRFSEARARRRRLYTHFHTCDITPEHIKSVGGAWELATLIGVDGEVAQRLWALAHANPPEAARGVGPWTIQNVYFMESVCDPEPTRPIPLYLEGDKMLKRRREKLGLGDPESWGEHRGVVTWLLWR